MSSELNATCHFYGITCNELCAVHELVLSQLENSRARARELCRRSRSSRDLRRVTAEGSEDFSPRFSARDQAEVEDLRREFERVFTQSLVTSSCSSPLTVDRASLRFWLRSHLGFDDENAVCGVESVLQIGFEPAGTRLDVCQNKS